MGYRCFLLWFMAFPIWSVDIVLCLEDCPAKCFCLGTYVDCSQKSLTALPDNLPSWADSLDLSSGKLNEDAAFDLSHLDNLTDLKLTKNAFTAIPYIGHLKALRKLSLFHNGILAVQAEPLAALPLLEDLNLNKNLIKKLGPESFPANSSIKTLHLSRNRIQNIQKGAFDNLTGLIELRLNKNNLSHLAKHSFQQQKFLKVLDLNSNHFQKMDGLVFQGLKHLSTLRLRHNKIAHFSDAAFFGLEAIVLLQLDHNSISSVGKGWLYGLETLITLSLSHNAVRDIEPSCWEPACNLLELDLSNNHLEGIYGNTFEHLALLKKLKLDGNRISTIAENAFSHTPALEVLQLAHNQISWTVEDMNGPFSRLNSLLRFSLASNHIKSISNKAFLGLTSLTSLDLNDNNITSLQEDSFGDLRNLKELHLNTSSLLCDCSLRWLSLWLRRLPQPGSIKAVCAYPAWFRGKHLLHLNRDNFTCNDSPKPRIVEHPKTQLAIKGSTAHLHCRAVSSINSPMVFLWKRNNVNLTEPLVKERVTPTADNIECSSELLLPNIASSHSGKYQCIVSNTYGTTYSQKARITIVNFPKFIKTPKNITVKAGDTAKLECAANGEPAPQIAWQKDGGNDFPAARERRMHVMPTDDEFFIIGLKTSDTGVYSCTATNPAGVIISNASLTVQEAPSFVNAMENKEIIAGENVVLQCMFSGSPKPSLNWMKDGAPIVRTDRHFFTADDQLLIIVSTMPNDEGLYVCEITNDLGTKNDSTELRVIAPSVSTVNEDDMMGIIIITVVCCAVGTSIIWVVIIYQTRKRMNSAVPQFTGDSIQLAPLAMEAGENAVPHIFTDNISERSSCKDSGTGDSAKRSSLEVIPLDDFSQIAEMNAAGEGLSLLREEPRHSPHLYYEGSPEQSSSQPGGEEANDSNRTYPYS